MAPESFALWARDLASYRTNLQNDGNPSSVPDYVLPPTIPCYDCHDFHGVGGINNVPSLSLFDVNHRPQNIAFGFTKNGTGSMTEDAPGGSVSGYYENKPPAGSSTYGADPGLDPSDNAQLPQTGGHYFKRQDPTGITGDDFDIGDKLPCRDCHDPHAWSSSWQAFIRPNLGGSIGWSRITPPGQPTASASMANEFTSAGARSDANSRTLCIACHGDSDSQDSVNFSDVSARYSASAGRIVRPPDSIAEHRSGNQTACVSCHEHNAIDAACGDCHGYPPAGYPAGKNPEAPPAGNYAVHPEETHARHIGRLDGATARFSPYSYDCKVCHADSGLHQDNDANVVYDLSSLGKANPPSFRPFIGSTYVRTTCGNVYCHSLGLSDNAVAAYYRSVTWGTAALGCNGCHGAATAPGTAEYGMPNDNDYAPGAGGSATANSHRAHVVNNGYECSVCHFNTAAGTYQAGRTIKGAPNPNAWHVNGARDVTFDGATASGSYNTDNNVQANNKRCAVSCHNSEALPIPQRPQWGNPSSATCTACHLSSGADSDQYLNGTDTWFQNNATANIDNAEWFWSGHGRTAGAYDVSGRPAANLLGGGTGENPCLYCHDLSVGHKSAVNPFRLKDQTGVSGYGALGWNATCLVCHRKVPAPPGYDPDGPAAAYANKVAAAAFVDNSHYGTKHGSGNNGGRFCWDCHDPHGDRNQAGSGNIFMVHKQSLARRTEGVFGFPGASGALSANPPVFTSASTGADYAGGAPYQGICQVCHAATAHYTANSSDGHHAGTRCTGCHAHDAGFRPTGCEGCHGYPPFDPGGGNPVAPNVMTTPDNSLSYWAQSGHGRWADDAGIPASYRPTCDSCHDIALPAGPVTHQDNTLNSAEAQSGYNVNTFHLKATVNGVPTLPSASSPDGTQPLFDNFCWLACHSPRGLVADHRHTKDAAGAARFGRKGTYADPWPLLYPPGTDNALSSYGKPAGGHIYTDSALTTHAPLSGFWYAPCVSCHDPHGTGATSLSGGRNKMVRGNFNSALGTDFCDVCHR